MKSYGKMMYAASIDVTDVFSLFDAVTIEGSTTLETSTGLSLCHSCYVMGLGQSFAMSTCARHRSLSTAQGEQEERT